MLRYLVIREIVGFGFLIYTIYFIFIDDILEMRVTQTEKHSDVFCFYLLYNTRH